MRFFGSKTKAETAANPRGRAKLSIDHAVPVDAVRTRARRRLMGALALLIAGVLGFPLLFDTKPRPMAGDLPMEVVRRDGSVAPSAAGQKVNKPLSVTTVPEDAGSEMAAASAPTAVVARAASAVLPTAAATAPAQRPVSTAPPAAPAPAPVAAPVTVATGRFVVQVGAYSAMGPMREARAKVEKLGLKTYTQVVETDAGPRTRLRVGPFDKREQADAAAAKLKRADLPANILTL
jgi:DedD protein